MLFLKPIKANHNVLPEPIEKRSALTLIEVLIGEC